MSEKIKIKKWDSFYESGAKRANLRKSNWLDDWFVGYGKSACDY